MINVYAKEFKAIVKYILKSSQISKKGRYLIVSKETVVDMLNKNAYDTHFNKLKIWKGLNWIDTEERRLTKRVVNKESGKQVLSMKIDLRVYETLLKLKENE